MNGAGRACDHRLAWYQFVAGDLVAVIGNPNKLAAFEALVAPLAPDSLEAA